MKNLFFSFLILCISLPGFSQTSDSSDNKPVYLRFPTIPQFTVFKAPDSTAFSKKDLNKKRATVFFIFSPDCDHCQHETEALTKNIKKFGNTQILMITHLPYDEMINFYKTYKIANYPQIIMARDTKYFFPVFFNVKFFPSIFVYDKNGNLKKSFEGSVKIEDILAEL